MTTLSDIRAVLDTKGLRAALWRIDDLPREHRIAAHALASDIAERALRRHEVRAKELDDSLAVIRRYADGEATETELWVAYQLSRDFAIGNESRHRPKHYNMAALTVSNAAGPQPVWWTSVAALDVAEDEAWSEGWNNPFLTPSFAKKCAKEDVCSQHKRLLKRWLKQRAKQ